VFGLICMHVSYVNASFHNISVMDISFIGRGNQSTWKKQPTGNLRTLYHSFESSGLARCWKRSYNFTGEILLLHR